jgi:hypothetical protein
MKRASALIGSWGYCKVENTVFLQSWDKAGKFCAFDLPSGKFKWIRNIDAEQMSGHLKTFLFRKFLAIYQLQGTWWIQWDRNRSPLSIAETEIQTQRLGILTLIKIGCGRAGTTLVDLSISSLFARKSDPTYDGLDMIADDFPSWLSYLIETKIKT